ncbi:MAG: flagellar basal body-associated FliL family protein [Limnochordia bacterium]|jgi:flagellar basal body-associated protein FliL
MGKRRGLLLWSILLFLAAAVVGAYATTRVLGTSEVVLASLRRVSELNLGVFTVDLEPAERSHCRLLRICVVLETPSRSDLRVLNQRDAELKHVVISVLRGRNADSLIGPEGMDSLQREILQAVNDMFSAEPVTGVYFPEFVMQ